MGTETPKMNRAASTTARAAQQVMTSKATMPIVRIVLSCSKKAPLPSKVFYEKFRKKLRETSSKNRAESNSAN
jgi:hypothetical protein